MRQLSRRRWQGPPLFYYPYPFGQTDETGNTYLTHGGPQLQNRAIPGYEPEKLSEDIGASKFAPPINTGLGYLAALSDEQILAHADPLDLDGDGISGVPNYISAPDYFLPLAIHQPHNGKYIGRFGKKAAAVDLLHQTVNAYNQDIGITSSFDPIDAYTRHAIDPGVSDKIVRDVVFFAEAGCADCNLPTWVTPASDIAALSNKTFSPYTDLLLHDMGPALDNGYTEGTARTSEWRTPPLWGLGLSPITQGGRTYCCTMAGPTASARLSSSTARNEPLEYTLASLHISRSRGHLFPIIKPQAIDQFKVPLVIGDQ